MHLGSSQILTREALYCLQGQTEGRGVLHEGVWGKGKVAVSLHRRQPAAHRCTSDGAMLIESAEEAPKYFQ